MCELKKNEEDFFLSQSFEDDLIKQKKTPNVAHIIRNYAE